MKKQRQLLIVYSNGSSLYYETLGFRAGFKNYKPTHMNNPDYMRGYAQGKARRSLCVVD